MATILAISRLCNIKRGIVLVSDLILPNYSTWHPYSAHFIDPEWRQCHMFKTPEAP